jgi:hypothetical protein
MQKALMLKAFWKSIQKALAKIMQNTKSLFRRACKKAFMRKNIH